MKLTKVIEIVAFPQKFPTYTVCMSLQLSMLVWEKYLITNDQKDIPSLTKTPEQRINEVFRYLKVTWHLNYL